MPEEQEQTPFTQRIERDVRILLGDLQMQIIVLRSMLEEARGGQQPSEPEIRKPNGDGRPVMSS